MPELMQQTSIDHIFSMFNILQKSIFENIKFLDFFELIEKFWKEFLSIIG